MTLTFTGFKKLNTFLQKSVFHHKHVLCHVLNDRQETSFGVIPRVCAELFLIRLQTFDDSRYSELVVALGAVESAATHSNKIEPGIERV